MRLTIAKAQPLCYNIPVSNRRWPEGGERIVRKDVGVYEATPQSADVAGDCGADYFHSSAHSARSSGMKDFTSAESAIAVVTMYRI